LIKRHNHSENESEALDKSLGAIKCRLEKMGFKMFLESVLGLRRTKSRRERIPDCWSCNMKREWTKMKI